MFRKDFKREFGMLQAQFFIFAQPARVLSKKKLHMIMRVCMIFQNVIVEDEGGLEEELKYEQIQVAVFLIQSSALYFSDFVNN